MTFDDFSFSQEEEDCAEADTLNPYLADPIKGLDLIIQFTSRPDNEDSMAHEALLQRLHEFIHDRYVDLAVRDNFPAEAKAYRDLIVLEESLKDMVSFPDLSGRPIVGIGGGFSAGKSRFLNTLLHIDLLPEALEPTTAIPTYLACGQEEKIIALNRFAGKVGIDRDALQAVTHEFPRHYRDAHGVIVGFSHIVRLLMIHEPRLSWKNLAFLDTPGHSKADGESEEGTDAEIALRQLSGADHVLWLLSAKNGSIRADDLEFLRKLDHPKPIFFVVTQADLVNASQIRSILDSTAAELDRTGIRRAGLMAWAAPMGEARGRRVEGDDVTAWLHTLDGNRKVTSYQQTCGSILDLHIDYNRQMFESGRRHLSLFNHILAMAEVLPETERETLRQLVQGERENQKNCREMMTEFGKLKTDMLEVVRHLAGSAESDRNQFRQVESASAAEDLYRLLGSAISRFLRTLLN